MKYYFETTLWWKHKNYLTEGPFRVPCFQYNWLQSLPVESIQQLFFFAFLKIFNYFFFIIWIYFADCTLFLSNSDLLYQKVLLLHENALCQSLCSYFGVPLNIVLIFEKQTQLPYVVLPKRDVMHLQLHKLKGTLSIWGTALNVRCCY